MTALAAPQPMAAVAALLEPSRLSPHWLMRSIGALAGGLRPTIPEHFALTERQRQLTEEMLSRLSLHLAPASAGDVAKCVAVLQAQFDTGERDQAIAAARAEGYLIALDGVPLFALQEAVKRILRPSGTVGAKFMPKAPELRALVNEIALPARAHQVALRRLLEATVERSHRGGEGRELPPEVVALLTQAEGENRRPRHPPNPSNVDHTAPYNFNVKGE